MDLDFLGSLLTIADTKNITQAAEELNTSPSSLSNALRKLERELGKQLFDRVGNRLRLNEDGVFFMNYARKMTAYRENLRQTLQNSATNKGAIKIGVALENDTLFILLSAFVDRHPDIRIELYGEQALQGSWLSSSLDVFVVNKSDQRRRDLISDGLALAHWNNLFVLMRDGHRLSGRESIRLSELKDENFVFSAGGVEERRIEWVYDYCVKRGFTPKVSYLCAGFDGKLDIVANSDALAFVQNIMRQFRESMSGIRAIPLATDDVPAEDIVITWRSTPINPLVNVFIDFAREFVRRGRDSYI